MPQIDPDHDRHDQEARGRGGFFLSKFVASALLVALLSRWVDWRELWRLMLDVRAGRFLLSYVFVLLGEVFLAARLRQLLRSTELCYSIRDLVRISLISQFFAIFLPAGIGQAAARWYKVTRNQTDRLQFALVTIIEKVIFFIITILCGGLPVLLLPDPRLTHLRAGLLPFLPVALGLSISLLYLLFTTRSLGLLERLGSWLVHTLARRIPPAAELKGTFAIYRGRGDLLSPAIAWTLAFQVTILLRIALLFTAVGVTLPWYVTLWISSFVFFIQAIPVSFAGVGVREAAFAYAFEVYGLNPEAGALAGLLFLGQLLISACTGGLLELVEKR